MAGKKSAAKSEGKGLAKAAAKKPTKAAAKVGSKAPAKAANAMPKSGKDPKGGLTAKGRQYFAQKEGAHLRPGVQGPADTPEKMVRKGSFLRRHFANPRGPMKDDKGEPTRLALSAHAWGEDVPETMADAGKLAAEGHELLEQYHAIKDGEAGGPKKATKAGKAVKKQAAKGPGKVSDRGAGKPGAGKTALAKTSVKRARRAKSE